MRGKLLYCCPPPGGGGNPDILLLLPLPTAQCLTAQCPPPTPLLLPLQKVCRVLQLATGKRGRSTDQVCVCMGQRGSTCPQLQPKR
jgi:hypothetical protein